MSLLGWIALGVVGGMISNIHEGNKRYAEEQRKRAEEEKERKNTLCRYDGNISQYDFEQIVLQEVKRIKKRKITVRIDNAVIYGNVTSQSGISTWNFQLDFNDWGKLTGVYRFWSGNVDSVIPKKLAESISQEIKNRLQ